MPCATATAAPRPQSPRALQGGAPGLSNGRMDHRASMTALRAHDSIRRWRDADGASGMRQIWGPVQYGSGDGDGTCSLGCEAPAAPAPAPPAARGQARSARRRRDRARACASSRRRPSRTRRREAPRAPRRACRAARCARGVHAARRRTPCGRATPRVAPCTAMWPQQRRHSALPRRTSTQRSAAGRAPRALRGQRRRAVEPGSDRARGESSRAGAHRSWRRRAAWPTM